METVVVGTCGACGGRVMVPRVWMGVVPPEPTCASCGRTAAVGPVLPMTPGPPPQSIAAHRTRPRPENVNCHNCGSDMRFNPCCGRAAALRAELDELREAAKGVLSGVGDKLDRACALERAVYAPNCNKHQPEGGTREA